eukprot:2583377-Amphidinium_carterae.1
MSTPPFNITTWRPRRIAHNLKANNPTCIRVNRILQKGTLSKDMFTFMSCDHLGCYNTNCITLQNK